MNAHMESSRLLKLVRLDSIIVRDLLILRVVMMVIHVTYCYSCSLGKCHRIDNMLGSGGLGSGCYFHKVKPAGGYAITDDAAYESFTDLIGKVLKVVF